MSLADTPLVGLAHDRFSFARRAVDPFYTFLGPSPQAVLIALVCIVVTGQALLLLLFFTLAFSQRVHARNPTLVNLVLISCLAGTPALLL
jgi:hypothetical protein